MPITKERKHELVSQYVDLLKDNTGFVIIQFAGMGVTEIDALRKAVRDAKGEYRVAKNTLLTKALQQAGWPVPDKHLTGPSAIIFGMENLPAVAKAVMDFVKDKDKINVKGGVMGQDILNAAGVEAVSNLPTLDELHAQIAGIIVAPAQGLVNVLHAATGQIVNVLQAYEDKHNAPEAATA